MDKLREELAIARKDERQHWTDFERKAVENVKLRGELAQVRGDMCKLLAFANLVEPYVSNDHCHGKSELDHKLYDACFEIRPLITKWIRSYIEGEQLAHQPSDTDEDDALTGMSVNKKGKHETTNSNGIGGNPTA